VRYGVVILQDLPCAPQLLHEKCRFEPTAPVKVGASKRLRTPNIGTSMELRTRNALRGATANSGRSLGFIGLLALAVVAED